MIVIANIHRLTNRTKKELGKQLNLNKIDNLKFIIPYIHNNGTQCLEN